MSPEERRAVKAMSEAILLVLTRELTETDPRLWYRLGRDAIAEIESRRGADVPWDEIDAEMVGRALLSRYRAGRVGPDESTEVGAATLDEG